APHLPECDERAHRPGHLVNGVRDPRRGRVVVPRPRPATPVSVLGPGHQLLAAVPAEPQVVDERRAGARDLQRGLRLQLPRRRAAGRPRSALASIGLASYSRLSRPSIRWTKSSGSLCESRSSADVTTAGSPITKRVRRRILPCALSVSS